jgi:hypothetical protein
MRASMRKQSLLLLLGAHQCFPMTTEIIDLRAAVNEFHSYQKKYYPLHIAAKSGDTQTAKEILERGYLVNGELQRIDINQKNSDLKETPLIVSAAIGHVEMVKFLLENGADKDAVDCYKRTALHHAALEGHLDVVQALVKAGASAQLLDKDEQNPAMKAIFMNHDEIAFFLLVQPNVEIPIHFFETFKERNQELFAIKPPF